MSLYAYLDKTREQIVHARDCSESDRGQIFYCFNHHCNEFMSLVLPSEKANHFRILKPNLHNGCKEFQDFIRYVETEYNETEFNLESAIDDFMAPKKHETNTNRTSVRGSTSTAKLSSIKKIFSMCKHYDYDCLYNSVEIWKILRDDRCNYIFTKGIWGKCLIECYFQRYDDNQMSIYFKYPLNPALQNQYIIKTVFDDNELFNEVKRSVYKRTHIVLAGNWKSIDNRTSQTNFLSKKQLWVIET
jgi:hypothetical protein